jgi:cytochrome c biogenesis protein ResB
VTHPGTEREHVEEVTMSTSEIGRANVWFTGDERFALVFLENTEGFPFDWRSVLAVWETDADGRPYKVDAGSKSEREIRVNDYFTYRGYRFFQTNATPEDPTYSGIGVVYDPGIPIVLLGMYTIIAGTILAFMVRPIVLSWRRKEASA